jgi:hypothetical protein
MKSLVLSLSLAAVLAPGAVWADEITGYVSDAHCGATHNRVSDANTKCINGCLKNGTDPVLVNNGKVLKFDADSKEKAKAFAGEDVKIDGSINDGVVKIDSITKAQ